MQKYGKSYREYLALFVIVAETGLKREISKTSASEYKTVGWLCVKMIGEHDAQ